MALTEIGIVFARHESVAVRRCSSFAQARQKVSARPFTLCRSERENRKQIQHAPAIACSLGLLQRDAVALASRGWLSLLVKLKSIAQPLDASWISLTVTQLVSLFLCLPRLTCRLHHDSARDLNKILPQRVFGKNFSSVCVTNWQPARLLAEHNTGLAISANAQQQTPTNPPDLPLGLNPIRL